MSIQVNAEELHEKLLERTTKLESGCWIPAGSRNYIRYKGRQWRHRRLWYLYANRDPKSESLGMEDKDGQELRLYPDCSNIRCINPDHMARKPNLPDRARGERHGMHKLTENQVREIRERIAGGEGNREIAGDYGVTFGAVYSIRRGKAWRHVG